MKSSAPFFFFLEHFIRKLKRSPKEEGPTKNGEKYNCPNCPTQLMCSIHKIKEALMLIKQREREKAGTDRKMCRFFSRYICTYFHSYLEKWKM